jgi:type II secretory ATPase GspE/PulE/Tfp pilus assembly ATPase PilB-like protein
LPQDGRFSKTIGNNEYDFRVSTLPTISGESILVSFQKMSRNESL